MNLTPVQPDHDDASAFQTTNDVQRLIDSARDDGGLVPIASVFASILGRVLPGGAVVERPSPKLEWLVDLPPTSDLEQQLRTVELARGDRLKLPRMPRDPALWSGWYRNESRRLALLLERARHRDAIQLSRPEGCWCLGLGAHAGRACTCTDGQRSVRQEEVKRQVYLQERELHVKERHWATLAIPPEYEHITLEGMAGFDPDKAALVHQLREWFEGPQWLLLHGPVGRGKTALLCALLKLFVGRLGQSALLVNVPMLLDRVRATYRPGSDQDESNLMEPLFTVDVLGLDDLGAHTGTEWELTKLRTLINYRYSYHKRTIVTTNLDPFDIAGKLDARIGSRLLQGHLQNVDGRDLRIVRRVTTDAPW